ncbi:MAG: hypothetical protein HY363_05080 [Candidatus Aenigmarchaeota archaeon]|nr:hypothetical protein [Candidatus Aenigmarchaeota archaeon]
MTQTFEERMKSDLGAAMIDEQVNGKAMRMFFLDYCKEYPRDSIEEVYLGQPPGMPHTIKGKMIFTKANVECLHAKFTVDPALTLCLKVCCGSVINKWYRTNPNRTSVIVETYLTKPTGTSLDEIRYSIMPHTYSACPVDEAVQKLEEELNRGETVTLLDRRPQERFLRTICFMDDGDIYLRVGEGQTSPK